LIERITIQGFKSLRDVSLTLGPLNIFIGTNASGKSNFFDALRVVQGVAHGFSIDEIFNGKPRTSSSDMWEGIRGGSAGAAHLRWDKAKARLTRHFIRIRLTLSGPALDDRSVEYSIGISSSRGRVIEERLKVSDAVLYDTQPIENTLDSPAIGVRYYAGRRGRQPHLQFESSRPVLQQIGRHKQCAEEHRAIVERVLESMGDMQRLDPSPAILREYSRGPYVERMGERGENFAALVNLVYEDKEASEAYLSWLQRLTPSELHQVRILHGALGEPLFAVDFDHKTFAAPVLSDGTLRFAAIAAAFFQPDMPNLLMIEELENGIHPTRLRLLVDLLKSQASERGPQVLATTHSPVVLSWLEPGDYEHVFLCAADETAGASRIVPINEVPRFTELSAQQSVADLFAEGWLESTL
jgi:predicted ATPase